MIQLNCLYNQEFSIYDKNPKRYKLLFALMFCYNKTKCWNLIYNPLLVVLSTFCGLRASLTHKCNKIVVLLLI